MISFKTFLKDIFSSNNKIECSLDECNNRKRYLETYYKYKVYYDIIADKNIHCLEHVISAACYPFLFIDINDSFLKTCQKIDNTRTWDHVSPESFFEHFDVIKPLSQEVPLMVGKSIYFGFINVEITDQHVFIKELPITDFIHLYVKENK